MIAWKDGPEARRAVSAALPLMREADRVFVASSGRMRDMRARKTWPNHLARHDAHVTAHRLHTADDDGSEILRFALLQEADLIVLGAYGHSRCGSGCSAA